MQLKDLKLTHFVKSFSSNRSISNLGKILIQFCLYKTNLYYITTYDGSSVLVVNL